MIRDLRIQIGEIVVDGKIFLNPQLRKLLSEFYTIKNLNININSSENNDFIS